MSKRSLYTKFTLLFSLFLIFAVTVQSTMAFVVTETQTITNIFQPIPGLVNDLLIEKKVEHPYGTDYVIPENIAFDFAVDLGSGYAGKTVSTTNGEKTADADGMITVTAKPGASVGIQGILEGTKVTVTELQKENDGFAVQDGIARKEAVISATETVAVEFVNVYTPTALQPLNVYVSGNKTLEGRDWQEGDIFTFLLEQQDADGNWVALGTQSVMYDAENADFNKFDFNDLVQALTFSRIGTYSFRLSEVAGNLEGMAYDTTVKYFDLMVSDTDMDGKLELQNVTALQNATVTYDEEADTYHVAFAFNNTFTQTESPRPLDIQVPVTVNKHVTNTGDETIGPENFQFMLEKTVTGDKLTLKSDENGKAVFDLTFTADDVGKTYSYKLSEINDGREGVVYSTAVYTIEISVSLGDDNKLLATVSCNGEAADSVTAVFENTYNSEKPDTTAPPTSDTTGLLLNIVLMVVSGIAILLLSKKCVGEFQSKYDH